MTKRSPTSFAVRRLSPQSNNRAPGQAVTTTIGSVLQGLQFNAYDGPS